MSDPSPSADTNNLRATSPAHPQNAPAERGPTGSDQSNTQHATSTGPSRSNSPSAVVSAFGSPASASPATRPRPKLASSSSLSRQLWANSVDDPQIDERDSIFATTYFPTNSPPSSNFRPPPSSSQSKSTYGEPTSAVKLPVAGATRRKVTFNSQPVDIPSPSTTPKSSLLQQSITTLADYKRLPIDIPAKRADVYSTTTLPLTLSRPKTVQMGDLKEHQNDVPQSQLGSPIQFSTSPIQFSERDRHELNGEDEDERMRYRSWREGKPDLRVASASKRSKSGEARVDRKIEAILPKVDAQAKSTRSRKSSQYMGLFKENDTSLDQKRRHTVASNGFKEDQKSDKSIATEGSPNLIPNKAANESREPGTALETVDESTSSTDQGQSIYEAPSHGGPRFREGSLPSNKSIPDLHRKVLLAKAGAVESIRNSSMSEGDSAQSSEQQLEKEPMHTQRHVSIGSNASTISSEQTERGRSLSEYSFPTEEDEESEKEHISSATYIPHRQVRPDMSPLLDLPRRPTVLRTQSVTVPKHVVQDAEEEVDHGVESPHEVEISLKSQGEEQLWHGAMSGAAEIADSPPNYSSSQDYEGASSASGFESLDESAASTTGYDSEDDMLGTSPNTPKALTSRRKTHRAREPMSAVPLKPFRHQVGGHNTVFQFSRKTICKKMNNRENVFYEVVEKYHPELLDFMPRYIGVLNVTFSKAPKRKRDDSTPKPDPSANTDDTTQASKSSKLDIVTPQPRIVSHSQQSISIPQVIFEQNRHIIPENLFRVPPAPTSPAQLSPHSRDPRRLSYSRPLNPIESISRDSSPRPHIKTWGSTRVNRRLQEQVLREVFAPPMIHRHRHHARHHISTGELPLQPASLGTSSPVGYQRSRSDIQQTFPDPAFIAEESTNSSIIGAPLSLSRTAPDEDEYLDQRPLSSSNSVSSASRTVRRRHSGSGLRRRPIDVVSGRRSGLEFHEEDGYGADQEDEVFAMDNDDEPPKSASTKPDEDHPPSKSTPPPKDAPVLEGKAPAQDDARPALTRQPSRSNTVQSQSDARVEMFILLEDLTARMEKPCVLDLKMGTRQYGVEADEKKQRSQRRKCQMTTSRELGVRVCGMQVWNVKTESYLFEDKYFGRDLKAGAEFQAALARYFFDGLGYSSARRYIPVILDQLSKLERIVRVLPGYRLYASSLLIIYDRAAEDCSAESSSTPPSPPDPPLTALPHQLARAASGPPSPHIPLLSSRQRKVQSCPIKIKIVDFANCVTKEDTLRLEQATIPPHNPNGVDRGYLRGLRTLKLYFQRIWKEVGEGDWVERGEGEGMELEGRKGAWNDASMGWDDPGNVSV